MKTNRNCSKSLSLQGRAALTAFAIALLLAGCGEKKVDSYTSGTFTAVYNQTLKTACIECHVPTGAAWSTGARLDFTSQDTAYTSLTSQTVSGASSLSCGGNSIVSSGDTSRSYILAVLFSEYASSPWGGDSDCVPYNEHHSSQSLSSDEKTSLVNWISSGASNN